MPTIKKLWQKENVAILVWPGEEPLELAYNAVRICVPPRDVVARPGAGSPYTHPAATLNGKPLPGTAVISDQIMLTVEGGYKTVLAIDHVCRYLVRDRDDLFSQGFNIVETADQVQEAMTLGLPLYAQSQDQRAREVLARELQRQKGYKDRGEIPPPALGEHLVSWAMKHLRTRGPAVQAHKVEDIEAVLQGRDVAPAPSSVPSERLNVPSGKAMVGMASADSIVDAAALFLEAQDLGVKFTGIEMANLLKGNAKTIEQTRIKIEAKKVEAQAATA